MFSAAFAGNYALYDRDTHNEGFPNDAAGIALQNTAIADPNVLQPRRSESVLWDSSVDHRPGRQHATTAASNLINNYPLWGGYTDGDYTDRYFRSDALQVRVQKTLSNSPLGHMTAVLSYTFSKEYAQTCCIGTNWTFNTGAYLQLSPNGITGTLVPHQQDADFRLALRL